MDTNSPAPGKPCLERLVSVVVAAVAAERVARAVANLLDAADLPVRVEVVAYGQGPDLVLDGSEHAEAVHGLQGRGTYTLPPPQAPGRVEGPGHPRTNQQASDPFT